jgi:hypothetical protein
MYRRHNAIRPRTTVSGGSCFWRIRSSVSTSAQAFGSNAARPSATAERRLAAEVSVAGFRCPLIASIRESSSCDTLLRHLAHSAQSTW